MSLLWIKICGIRDTATASKVAELGADAIGLNFYDGSPRCISDVAAARDIVAALPSTTRAVGVFVNHTVGEIHKICDQTGITTVQLHGDEPDDVLAELTDFRVIRALRTSGDFASEAAAHLQSYEAVGQTPAQWLIDARVPGLYGGSGQTVDWDAFQQSRWQSDWPDLILAGGLTSQNVEEAVRLVQPWGVDVASGVESAPGVKNLRLVEQFLSAARRGFANR